MKRFRLNNISSVVLIIMLALAVLPATPAKAAGEIITSTATGGAWGDTTTWVGGVVPDLADDSVVIATTGVYSVTLSGPTTIYGSLTINSAARLDTANFALTLEGDFVNNGVFDAGSSNITLAGTAPAQSIAGFTTTGTVSMTKTAGGVATFIGDVSGGGLTMNGLGGTLNLGVGLSHTFTGAWTRTNGTLEGGLSSVRVNGTVSGSTGTFTPGTSTFTYGGTTQSIAGVTYYRLQMQGIGVKTALGNITVNENLSINTGSNFTIGAFDITVTGTTSVTGILTHNSPLGTKAYNGLVTINPGGVWKNDATGNADIHFHGGLTHNGTTFSAGTGAYYFDTNDQAISGSSAIAIPNLTVEDGKILTNNSVGLTVNMTLKGTGTPDINGYTGGTLSQGATGVLNIGMTNANFTLLNLNASTAGNTVNYSLGGAQTVRNILYHHLTLSNSGVKTLFSGMTHITGNLYLSGTASSTTVDNLDIDGNLTIDQGASLTIGGFNFNVDGTTTVTGSATATNGKLIYGSVSGIKSYIGLVTIGANGVWDNPITINAPIFFEGGLMFSGKTFTAGNGLYTFQTSASQPIGGTVALNIPNLAVDVGVNLTNGNTGGLTINTALSGAGTLTQGAGSILNIGTTIVNFTLSDLFANAAANTVNYNGSAQNVRAITYHHLTLSTSGAKSLAGLTTINGNLTLSGTASAIVDPDPISALPANFTIGGNLAIGTGTIFTVGGDHITVTGNTIITGSGQLIHNNPTGDKLYTGLVTVNGVWINSGDESINFRGGLAYGGTTFTAGAGVYTFETTPAQTIDGTISIPNLTVASGVNLTNDGTITVGTALSGAGTWTQGTTGILNIGGTSGITTLTASAIGNTVNYNSASPQTVMTIATPYHHLTLSAGSVKTLAAGLTTINGNLTLSTTGTSATTAADLTIGGILNIGAGATLDVSASNYAINVGGNWTNAGTFTPRAGTVTLQGSAAQAISGASGVSSFHNLTLNNAAGATLSANATVNNILTLTNGKITTNANTLIVGNGGSVTGAASTKYIFGNLQKAFSISGSPQSFTFAIGDATVYRPVDLTIASVSTAGNITAKTAAAAGEHPNIATITGFNQNKDVNRYWTLTPATIVFSTYDATFNFVSGDLDVGATPTSFIVKRYQSPTSPGWNSTTIATQTAISTQASGIPFTTATNVYSYAIGEGESVPPTVTNITSSTLDGSYNVGDVISGIAVTFSEVVNVTGTPQLTLETGTADRIINYAGGTGTDTLTFANYTVQAGDTSSDLDANSLVLNGGTIKDTSNNAATLTLSGTSLATNKAIVIDTTAPNTQIDTQPSDPTNSTSAAFTFSADETATFECQMDGGGYGVCGSPYTLAAGPHTFDVRATDLAGNVDATPASYSWTIDTTAPNTQIDTQPSDPTNSTSAAFTFSADETATFECQMDGGGYGVCGSPYTLAAGPHTFDVRATDLAGNVDATPASYSWTIDTTAPNTQIDTQPSDPTNSTSAAFTFSADETATFECQMDGGGYGVCGSPYTLAAGPHTFDVRATDLAGNVDATPASYSWTIDTTAPNTQIDTQPSDPTNSTSAAFTFSADETATFECQMDGGGYGVCGSPYTLAAGPHTFDVRATDLAGNVDATPASYSWTIDTTAPTVLSSTLFYLTPTARATVQFTVTFSEPVTGVDNTDFSLTPAATVKNAAITTVVPVSTTVYTVTVNTGSGNGTLRLNVLDNNSIKDLALNPQNGAFTTGQFYTVNKTLTYQSINTNDGWVLESTVTSSKGDTFNSTATTFNLGDDAARKQYRGILHFNTVSLPDNAVITSATLKIMKSAGGKGVTSTLGALLADMTKPSFGSAALAKTDFEAVAGKPNIFNAFQISGSWYSAALKSTGFTYVNRTGTTQFRLRFTKGDDGDAVADYLLFFSGNAPAASRPQLIIEYYVP